MSQTAQCRLCLQTGADQKQLYDESGELNIEIFNKMKTFFNPKFLNISMFICLRCWQRISDFHDYMQHMAQCRINKEKLTDLEEFADTNRDFTLEINEYANTVVKNEISVEEAVVNFNDNLKPVENNAKGVRNKRKRPRRDVKAVIAKWTSDLECGVCKKPHEDFSALCQHFKLEHINVKAHILCCNTKLRSLYAIADHASFHLDPETFKCPECASCHTNWHKLEMHIKDMHKVLFPCNVCGKNCRSSMDLNEHMAGHTKMPLYQCRICSATFRRRKSVYRHMKTAHTQHCLDNKNFESLYEKTEILSKQVHNKVKLQQRSKVTSILPYKHYDDIISQWKSTLECGICQKSCENFSVLSQHFSLAHPSEKPHHFCCERKLSFRWETADHVILHMDPEAYKCHKCGKCLAGRIALRIHMKRMHSHKEQLICSVCNKNYNSIAYLRKHMASHAKTALYRCLACEQTFSFRHNMNKHMKKEHPQVWSERKNIPNFYETTKIESIVSESVEATSGMNETMPK